MAEQDRLEETLAQVRETLATLDGQDEMSIPVALVRTMVQMVSDQRARLKTMSEAALEMRQLVLEGAAEDLESDQRLMDLLNQYAALREIVDALANEDRYQAETGEGSMAYLARLKAKAREVLAATSGSGSGTR